jgi:hypothetical protein
LATTVMMLASTVQFSRYGRSRPCDVHCGRFQPVLTEGARDVRGRSLRTQQRARPVNPPPVASLPPAALTPRSRMY